MYRIGQLLVQILFASSTQFKPVGERTIRKEIGMEKVTHHNWHAGGRGMRKGAQRKLKTATRAGSRLEIANPFPPFLRKNRSKNEKYTNRNYNGKKGTGTGVFLQKLYNNWSKCLIHIATYCKGERVQNTDRTHTVPTVHRLHIYTENMMTARPACS